VAIHPFISEKLPELTVLCREHGVEQCYLFGSAATKSRFRVRKSDIDLILLMRKDAPLIAGRNILKLYTKLEDLFGRKVDIITKQPVRNIYLQKSLDKSKILVYDSTQDLKLEVEQILAQT
jgi:uncharacterized protein